MDKCTLVHPLAINDAPCCQNEGNFTKAKTERKASYLQKYLFATNKTCRFVFSVPKSLRKTYLHTQVIDWCTGLKIPNYDHHL